MKKKYFLIALSCFGLGIAFGNLITGSRDVFGNPALVKWTELKNKVTLGPFILVANDGYDEFVLTSGTGSIIVSQLKDEKNAGVISRQYYTLGNGIDFFCSLDFDKETKKTLKSSYCLPLFVDKEKKADTFRYMYFDKDGDGQWDVFIDQSSGRNVRKRFEREGYNWVLVHDLENNETSSQSGKN